MRWPTRGRRIVAGHRVTTAGPSRLRHRARGGIVDAAGRRQPGHRTGPVPGSRGAGAVAIRGDGGSPPVTRVRIRFAKLGKIRWTVIGTWPACGSGRSDGCSCRWPTAPATPASQGQLRSGPSHRSRVCGRVPGHRIGLSDRTGRLRSPPPARPAVGGAPPRRRRHRGGGDPPRNPLVTGGRHRVDVALGGRPQGRNSPARIGGAGGSRRRGADRFLCRRHPDPQGRGADRRHPGRYQQPASARARRARSFARRVAGGRPGLQASLASAFRGPGGSGRRSGGTPGAKDASMDFARRRPTGTASGGRPARRDGRPHALERAS